MEKNPIQVRNFGFFFKIPLLERPFFSKKKCLRSCSKLAQMKFRENKCAQFSSFLILLKKCGKKIRFKFENREKFYKGFPCKNIFLWKSFVKLTRNFFTKDFLLKKIDDNYV